MSKRILQIIPAMDWVAEYSDLEGPKKIECLEVVCWALVRYRDEATGKEHEEVEGLVPEENRIRSPLARNFTGYARLRTIVDVLNPRVFAEKVASRFPSTRFLNYYREVTTKHHEHDLEVQD